MNQHACGQREQCVRECDLQGCTCAAWARVRVDKHAHVQHEHRCVFPRCASSSPLPPPAPPPALAVPSGSA
eukprot:15439925-Alexandrium_andersonii.AAC.1